MVHSSVTNDSRRLQCSQPLLESFQFSVSGDRRRSAVEHRSGVVTAVSSDVTFELASFPYAGNGRAPWGPSVSSSFVTWRAYFMPSLQVGLTLILPALILVSTLLAYLTMLAGTWCICAVAKPVAPFLSEKTLFPPLNLPCCIL